MFGLSLFKLGAGVGLIAALAGGVLYAHHMGAKAEAAKLHPVIARQKLTIADLNAAAARNLDAIAKLKAANHTWKSKFAASMQAATAVADAERKHSVALEHELSALYAKHPRAKALAATPMPPSIAAKFNGQP